MNNKNKNKFDPVCELAITLLEITGNVIPTEEQINIVSCFIVCLIQEHMNNAINYKRLGIPDFTKSLIDDFLISLKRVSM